MPLLQDEIATNAMVRHTMEIIDKVHEVLRLTQVPVKLLMLLGPLHIEMAFLNTIGDWLECSGWVDIIVKSEVNTPGRAEALLKGNHPKRSIYAHQVICISLSMLLQESFEKAGSDDDIEKWIVQRKEYSIQFLYWFSLMEMEALLLMFVKSIRSSNFDMFVKSVELIVPWMFALDHTHYARWPPVFVNVINLSDVKHPDIYSEFQNGNFTVNKTKKSFSSIGIDQAHEQNNKLVKIDSGAVGILLSDSTAL